ncbi:MAG TPA: NUDIX hydrolase [Candidatus Bilamarchaeum sp.]|nr:NUDIX hydrolase [Candidatus Bilamarchaeum sp.]
MGRRRIPTGTPVPKALACGMLEDEGRVLFLIRKDEHGTEKYELPCTLVPSGRSPFADIKGEFERQTGIECQVHEIVREGRHNAGSRKRRSFVPVLVFKISARTMRARPSPEFSGFKWLRLEDAVRMRLARSAEWLRKEQKKGDNEGKGQQAGP